MDGCLNNNVEQPALASLGVYILVVTSFDTKHDFECMADRDGGALVFVCKVNPAAFGWKLELMCDGPWSRAHE